MLPSPLPRMSWGSTKTRLKYPKIPPKLEATPKDSEVNQAKILKITDIISKEEAVWENQSF